VSDNQLASLDVSQNTALGALFAPGNRLASLDVSRNTALKVLDVAENRLPLSGLFKMMGVNSLNAAAQTSVSLQAFSDGPLVAGKPYDLSAESEFNSVQTTFSLTINGADAKAGENYTLSGGSLVFLDRGAYQIVMSNREVHNGGQYGDRDVKAATRVLSVCPAGGGQVCP
jgi:hypothetical protein